ncbi:hypothetical protein M422DRAFT_33827 [Sphaerobolus stellatus SS14]|uniref:Uncharacterized protein n=1 Tax=Sphaerobolus stellatus (strain SS14) TaxID=990650 RepID=A0A0C9VID1_SPHS4|nr:hypothetical protein M422DRAFT_33827 [Sphaerobolus stellatus SS14]
MSISTRSNPIQSTGSSRLFIQSTPKNTKKKKAVSFADPEPIPDGRSGCGIAPLATGVCGTFLLGVESRTLSGALWTGLRRLDARTKAGSIN